jgi:succinate dehydrogenase / fumarate reductase, cytochrome b subunit
MSLFRNLFMSSIGRKFLMAVTGLVLVGFVTGHLVGNLQIFLSPDHINGYAHFLQGLGPVLWIVRLVLLGCVAIHIWAAVVLTLESNAARGPQNYGIKRWLKASVASRYMRMSGVVVLAFILYHLAHFTLGFTGADSFKTHIHEWTFGSLVSPWLPPGILCMTFTQWCFWDSLLRWFRFSISSRSVF